MFSVCRLLSRRCHDISSILQLTPAPLRTGQAAFPYIRLLGSHSASLFAYSCQVSSHRYFTPCIVSLFLLSRPTNRGDLRSAGVTRFIARPLRHSGPHHSRRGPPVPSFYIGRGTRGSACRVVSPRASCARRSPGYLPVFEQLDAVWDPGVSASRSSLSRSPLGLRLNGKDRLVPKSCWFSGLCVRFRATLFTSLLLLVLLPAFAFSRYATERLTRPYSGGPARFAGSP